ncbi:MAG: hypothetical protein ACK41D_04895 [Rubricoccaceae bacterium]
MLRRAAFVALVVSLAACSERAPDPPAPEAPEAEAPEAPEAPGPGVSVDELLESREDYAAVLARLGPPREETAEPIENMHVEGQQDLVRTYVFDGLRIETYEVAGGPTLVREVEATDPRFRSAEGVGPGVPRAAIEGALGPPVDEAIDGPYYEIRKFPDDPTPIRVHVVYDGETARKVTWYPYID